MIPERDQRILLNVARAADQAGIRFFIVGAGARLLTHDWVLGLSGGRTTTDWDIAIHVASWADFERFRKALLQLDRGGVFTAGRTVHHLLHEEGGSVDVIPFGGLEAPNGTITWPAGDRQMSVAVFSACEAMCQEIGLPGGTTVWAATAPALVVMKAHAHADRFAHGESRDIRDIDFLLRTCAQRDAEERIFSVAGSLIADGTLLMDDVGAFLLGVDIAARVDQQLLEPLFSVIQQAADAYGPIATALVARA